MWVAAGEQEPCHQGSLIRATPCNLLGATWDSLVYSSAGCDYCKADELPPFYLLVILVLFASQRHLIPRCYQQRCLREWPEGRAFNDWPIFQRFHFWTLLIEVPTKHTMTFTENLVISALLFPQTVYQYNKFDLY